MKSSDMHEIVGGNKVSKHKGIFTARFGYFYRHGQSGESTRDKVVKRLTDAGIKHTVVDYGDHYAAFDGGAPIEKSSHFYVKFTIEE